LFCNLDDGSIIINPKLQQHKEQLEAENRYKKIDEQFLDQILAMINSHALKGLNSVYSEDTVRSHFHDYTKRILQMTIGDALFEDEESKRDIEHKNSLRIKMISLCSTIEQYRHIVKENMDFSAIQSFDIENNIMKLRLCKELREEEILTIFHLFLKYIKTNEQIIEVCIIKTIAILLCSSNTIL
jgi:hypothetical protein